MDNSLFVPNKALQLAPCTNIEKDVELVHYFMGVKNGREWDKTLLHDRVPDWLILGSGAEYL